MPLLIDGAAAFGSARAIRSSLDNINVRKRILFQPATALLTVVLLRAATRRVEAATASFYRITSFRPTSSLRGSEIPLAAQSAPSPHHIFWPVLNCITAEFRTAGAQKKPHVSFFCGLAYQKQHLPENDVRFDLIDSNQIFNCYTYICVQLRTVSLPTTVLYCWLRLLFLQAFFSFSCIKYNGPAVRIQL